MQQDAIQHDVVNQSEHTPSNAICSEGQLTEELTRLMKLAREKNLDFDRSMLLSRLQFIHDDIRPH